MAVINTVYLAVSLGMVQCSAVIRIVVSLTEINEG